MDLKYPDGFPDEYQPQIEAVLAKAELAFLTATKDVPRKDVNQWELHACNYIEAVVLAFANLCSDRRLIEKWLTSVSKFVFPRLPDHPDLTSLAQLPALRINHFVRKADEHVKRSEGWLAHLEQVGADPKRLVRINPQVEKVQKLPIPEDPADWDTKELRMAGVNRYIEKVADQKGIKLTKKDIWSRCGYNSAQDFQRWQRRDKKTSTQAKIAFIRFFTNEPHLKTLLLTILSISS